MSEHDDSNGGDRTPDSAEIAACLGPDCELDGKLRFRGWLRIDGTLVGEVIGDNLVVGPSGSVKADLCIAHLVVEGKVEGRVRASKAVEIRQSGQLRGDVETPSLFVDRGVTFEGHCRVTDGAGEADRGKPPG
jgi:cytoskeletal protein CcmA (bactofilin family)